MYNLNKSFQDSLRLILEHGSKKEDRTGIGTISYPGLMIRHDMDEGFPLLTLRKVPFKSASVELEGFIKGITSKKWYKDRGCNYWNQWCSPSKVSYATDEETKKRMEVEDDLGPVYGKQWINWETKSGSVNQLKSVIDILKRDPSSRRMVVSSWNVGDLGQMALVPCHFAFSVNVTDGKLNLFYYMRSCDFILGNNLNSYGLLLHLLAKEANLKEGVLVGFFADVHCYLNQITGANEILSRSTDIPLPKIETSKFTSIFDWQHGDTQLLNYNPLPAIKFTVAV
jgi:thymidylate synthase